MSSKYSAHTGLYTWRSKFSELLCRVDWYLPIYQSTWCNKTDELQLQQHLTSLIRVCCAPTCKAFPVQAHVSPEGFRRLQLPGFSDSRHMRVTKLSALRIGRFYPQGISLVFISVTGWIDPNWNRTRDPPAFSAVLPPLLCIASVIKCGHVHYSKLAGDCST